jgi:hypothetical protein
LPPKLPPELGQVTTQPFRVPAIVADPVGTRFRTIELVVGNRKLTVSPLAMLKVVQSMIVRAWFSVTSSSVPLGVLKPGAVGPVVGLVAVGPVGRALAEAASRLAARATTGAAARAMSQARRL